MTTSPQNPVSPQDRETFRAHLKTWQERLGLQGWRINLASKRPPKAVAADVECFYKDRLAKIRLNDDLGNTPVTSQSLEGVAVHELLHILFHPMVAQNDLGVEDDLLYAAEHAAIHSIQKLLTKGDI
jgi:hypothetical protein